MVKKKIKTSFVCQQCGYDSPAYLGKCPECGMWNTFVEFKQPSGAIDGGSSWLGNLEQDLPQKLSDIAYKERLKIQTEFNELNTVLGGGIVAGSVTLLAGDPGVGKSTLLLQLCLSLAQKGTKVLYISGEESVEQIKMRADRLINTFPNPSPVNTQQKKDVQISDSLFLISLSDPDIAFSHIQSLKPDLVIVDSIQTMQSTNLEGLSGSVGQVRYAALHFIRVAKQFNIPVILVGHVTKEGMVAGPMVLSHMVDTVLFLEGEKFTKTRILRSLKNRFGPVDEVGIFIMDDEGLKEVANPEQIFLTNRSGDVPGTVLVVTMEGSRAFLVELQALVVSSKLPMPRRVVSGVDQKRVELLLAVLQKHCGLPVDTMDVFVNVAGGLRISDPAVDLGICLAIYSSIKNISLSKIVGIAEVGLLGELREVSSLDKRIKEAKKLGFTNILTVKSSKFLNDVLKSLESKK